jgi:cytochrome P450
LGSPSAGRPIDSVSFRQALSALRTIGIMDLPPGPRAPAAWQTVAWMTRPGAFLGRVHDRFGDPVTIRTYWTEEPMVLFSHPEAVREVFRLDPAIAPAGQSWEFLRPFAGPHSILLLDGEEHLRERRLLQTPFHGERMRSFAPVVAELARRELGTWRGRVIALERMRHLTLEIILRVVIGARGEQEAAQLRAAIEGTLEGVRSMPRMLAMALVQRDLGPRSPWGRFRVAVERFDALLLELVARRRAEQLDDSRAARSREAGCRAGGEREGDSILSLLLEHRDEHGNPPTDRHLRDQLVALLVGGHDSSAASLAWAFERLARHPAVHARLRDGDPAYLDAVVKEVLRARPALTIAPRRLLEPVQIVGRTLPAGVQVAACLWLALRREDLWPQAAAFQPQRWLTEPPPNPMSWIPFGGGVRRCAGAPFAEMEMREVLRAAANLRIRPVRPEAERARRSMLVLTPHRGGELLVG